MDNQEENQRVRVHIEDHTGNKSREARIAANAPMRQIIPALIASLGLPATDPSGRPVTYHLAHKNRQLQADETLSQAGVQDGHTIILVPEMTAGRDK